MLTKLLSANAATSNSAEKISGQTKKQTNKQTNKTKVKILSPVMPMCPGKNLIKKGFIIYHQIIEKKKIIIWKLKIAVKHDFLLV